MKYIRGTTLVNKDFRDHEIGNDNRDNHRVVLADGVDALEISVCECYRRKTSQWFYVDVVDINIFNGMEMTLLGLTR